MISGQLHGPRPAPLAVNKSSSKIKKPLMNQSREPVVVYLKSPKIIHVSPREFMGLVQRLTGNQGSTSVLSHSSLSGGIEGDQVGSENREIRGACCHRERD
ncbi:hypothetical protein F0562_015901 [Nyssa sinensis]|uniref:VQ domain-containing protein n=1 Tax=Nyssa sinensis TaxID=561372 RepID=A0A5J4ZMH6_9ASTE|nr:hypothetical protein F0562_015901 [Nyssa sinensis]